MIFLICIKISSCFYTNRFALHSKVVDYAVGFIIGRAFSDVVKSLIGDLIMPPIGYILGGVAFTNLTAKLHSMYDPDGPVVEVRYGTFIQTVIELLLTTFVLFFVILLVTKIQDNKSTRKSNEYTPIQDLGEEVKVLMEIRDLLAANTNVKT